jgi:hypothetical protein
MARPTLEEQIMKRQGIVRIAGAAALSAALGTALVTAQGNGNRYSAQLWGGEEVPSVSTAAQGRITIEIDEAAEQIHYELTYEGLSSTVAQAHIHFAQPGVNGGIVLWLCEGTATAPDPLNPPACPAASGGSVSGTLEASDVTATSAAQQIAAGQFGEVVEAIRAGLAYANVHTATSPGGEIRGQLKAGGGHR